MGEKKVSYVTQDHLKFEVISHFLAVNELGEFESFNFKVTVCF